MFIKTKGMRIEQIYTNCLAHAAYFIESNGMAAVIDPLRDTDVYINKAKENKAVIKYIFETHFHADFVSGHIDLANKTGASIVFGPKAEPNYGALIAKDGQVFTLGDIKIKVIHTPGHTIESTCYLIYDEQGKEHSIFTGDTLFVGDVGRPDLMSGNLSKEELAAFLYNSLNEKIKILPDHIIVYPGHGAGSACGKNIGKETSSTIGEQKKNNYALRASDKEEFIKVVTADLPVPPPYFFRDAAINKYGYQPFDKVVENNLKALSIGDFKKEIKKGAIVLDTREALTFSNGFIIGAINIALNGDFAVWVGTLIEFNTPIILVTTEGQEKETITRLARIGFENIKGYLKGGMEVWIAGKQFLDTIPNYTTDKCSSLLKTGKYVLLDVRKKSEVEQEKIKGSVHVALNELKNKIPLFDKNEKWLVYCAGGYRSMIAASLMKASGISDVSNVQGGINKAKQIIPELIENG